MEPQTQNLHTEDDLARDVSAASGATPEFDSGDAKSVVLECELTALAGGSSPGITFTVQDSQDKSNWADVADLTELTAVGRETFRDRTKALARWVRVAWATSGTPTTATADFRFSAKR